MADYETLLKRAAARADDLAGEARKAAEAVRQVRERIGETEEDITRREKALAKHHARGAEKLTKSTSDFLAWQGRIRRLGREQVSAEEALTLLRDEVLPQAVEALGEAQKKLRRCLIDASAAVKGEAEARMNEHFAAAVAEHDAFCEARARVFAEYGQTAPRGDRPVVVSDRLARDSIHKTATGVPWLTVTPPKPAAAVV